MLELQNCITYKTRDTQSNIHADQYSLGDFFKLILLLVLEGV